MDGDSEGLQAMSEQHNRRRANLTDDDHERIQKSFESSQLRFFEMIGYDATTPASRQEIRKDHEFVRGARRAKGAVIAAFFTGIGGSLALWFWNAVGRGEGS
jgi:hypothetical protein